MLVCAGDAKMCVLGYHRLLVDWNNELIEGIVALWPSPQFPSAQRLLARGDVLNAAI